DCPDVSWTLWTTALLIGPRRTDKVSESSAWGENSWETPGPHDSRSETMTLRERSPRSPAPGLLRVALAATVCGSIATAGEPPRVVRHVVVSKEEGRFA